MSFDPLTADFKHTVHGEPSGTSKSQTVFTNGTTQIVHLEQKILDAINGLHKPGNTCDYSCVAPLLSSLENRINIIENCILNKHPDSQKSNFELFSTARKDIKQIRNDITSIKLDVVKLKAAKK
jgi:hypothetical protein